MKCLIIIPTTEHKIFKNIETQGQRPTWVRELNKHPDINILYYKSNSAYKETHISQDYILCPGNESKNILKKIFGDNYINNQRKWKYFIKKFNFLKTKLDKKTAGQSLVRNESGFFS